MKLKVDSVLAALSSTRSEDRSNPIGVDFINTLAR